MVLALLVFSAAEVFEPKNVHVEGDDDDTVLSTVNLACGVVRYGAKGGGGEGGRLNHRKSASFVS